MSGKTEGFFLNTPMRKPPQGLIVPAGVPANATFMQQTLLFCWCMECGICFRPVQPLTSTEDKEKGDEDQGDEGHTG